MTKLYSQGELLGASLEQLRSYAAAQYSAVAPTVRGRKAYACMTKSELCDLLVSGVMPGADTLAIHKKSPGADKAASPARGAVCQRDTAPVPVPVVPAPTLDLDVPRSAHVPTAHVPTAQPVSGSGDALAALIAQIAGASLSETAVRAICADVVGGALESALKERAGGAVQSHALSISVGSVPAVSVQGVQHERLPYLLACCAARVPVLLVGAAGTGKTATCATVAKTLDLAFYGMSISRQTSKGDILGYMIPGTGVYMMPAPVRAFRDGGLLLLDEMDAGDSGTLTILNMLLANDSLTLADGETVTRHADFVVIAASNTFGQGADRQYVGRNQLDAATLDRFAVLGWDYSEQVELAMCGVPVPSVRYETLGKSGYTCETWVRHVQAVRLAIAAIGGIRHIVSPRASKSGCLLLDVLPRTVLEDALLWRGIAPEVRKQIEAKITGKGGK